jgi:hypothetical protein
MALLTCTELHGSSVGFAHTAMTLPLRPFFFKIGNFGGQMQQILICSIKNFRCNIQTLSILKLNQEHLAVITTRVWHSDISWLHFTACWLRNKCLMVVI